MYDAPPTQDRFTVETLNSGGSDQYSINDVFFSATDDRGNITACDGLFKTVCEHEQNDLIGAPHNAIRHPDMPKGLFNLMWDRLNKAQTIAVYIKNKTASGGHYWVFAVLTPIKDGFSAVHFKPSSEHFPRIAEIYGDMLAREASENLSPSKSADMLLERVADLGFESYEAFMHAALVDETLSRETLGGQTPDTQLELLMRVRDGVEQIKADIALVDKIFKETHQIPFNMRLQAGRLEGAAGPISVISSNHREMTQRLETSVHQFHGAKGLNSDIVLNGAFLCSVSGLQRHVQKRYTADPNAENANGDDHYIQMFTTKTAQFDRDAMELMASISDRISQFSGICRDVRRLTSGLELTRIMCKIERSKLVSGTEGLDEIINRLTDAQDRISKALTKIEDASSEITSLVSTLNGQTANA